MVTLWSCISKQSRTSSTHFTTNSTDLVVKLRSPGGCYQEIHFNENTSKYIIGTHSTIEADSYSVKDTTLKYFKLNTKGLELRRNFISLMQKISTQRKEQQWKDAFRYQVLIEDKIVLDQIGQPDTALIPFIRQMDSLYTFNFDWSCW